MLPGPVCTVVLQGAGYLHLYCRLERAGLPVRGASLRASIELETGNGTVVGAPGRLLGDWGGGGEDAVEGDGIYSLTLAPPALGRYRFTVTATGDGVGGRPGGKGDDSRYYIYHIMRKLINAFMAILF